MVEAAAFELRSAFELKPGDQLWVDGVCHEVVAVDVRGCSKSMRRVRLRGRAPVFVRVGDLVSVSR